MLGVVGQQCCVRLHSGKATCKRKQHCWPTTPNIVGCYLLRPFGKPSCMLLGVVAQSLKPVKLSQPTTPNISFVPWPPKRSAIMLDPFAQLFQPCWGHARAVHMICKGLWVVSFPRCTAGSKIVGSCCIRLHSTANTHATTPNIVGATMLGVVASVCVYPKVLTVAMYSSQLSNFQIYFIFQ